MEKGILSIELIQDVWEEHKGVHDQLNDIIDMMILFDLICEIPDMHYGVRCIHDLHLIVSVEVLFRSLFLHKYILPLETIH